ncbi:UvrD-helicase domain-containing protein [Vannielia litorea]|uniref:UvrD-helicase domain-containing protein n=1 Tax=Vannielia litorea TaxID=1217970 RepID=UPI001BD10261|nr:UvrD-helicase domain-containing protein [Vannielia litorea]MBS8225749.1 hypothetical protein [Vannielia litorea]
MTKAFTVVPAGAGSGKTYRIKTDLMDWVRAKTVLPHRIMAVTFTEAAAGELKERIRSSLLAEGMVNEALDVERAYVSTIHSLGLRIMTEHAFATGSSPQPRHLSDAERDLLIRKELVHCEALDPIKANLPRFGYTANVGTEETAEDRFRSSVFRTIDLLRGLGDGGTDPALAEEATASLRASYGPVAADPAPLRDDLQAAATALLAEFPEGGKPFAGTTKAARDGFRDQHRALISARDGRELDHDWKLWLTLCKLRVKARGSDIPDDFVALSEAVMAAAGKVERHPGPLEDACTNLRSLILGAQTIMAGYAEKKRTAGVIDFSDMVVGAERLLRTQPEVLSAVLADIDCLIVDEFQDTNPVQFALLWRIAQAAPRTLLVGDTKQSIMGFQGADPRLTEELVRAYPDKVEPLDKNWRSDPRIMAFVNDVSANLFCTGYTPLEAQRPETGETVLDFVRIPQGRSSRAPNARPEQHIASRIKDLLDEGTRVADRHSDLEAPQMRPVRPGDIAILCQTHTQASRYADRLQDLGIPVRINREGWLTSPPVSAACTALSFVADPTDAHAALCLLTLGPHAMSLQDAMTALSEGTLLDHAVLAPLHALASAARAMPLASLLPATIDAAGVREWADSLPDPTQMRADLLRLETEAAEFEAAHQDMKAAAGFYGQSAQVFLGWLRSRQGVRDFDRHPDPGSGPVEGVEVVTWHASKGREWNIVVVTGLDHSIGEKPGTLRAEFGDFSDLSNVLAKAILRYTPSLHIPVKQDIFVEARRPAAEADARRLLYVALTRARDRLVLEWPDFKLKKPSEGPGPANFAEMLVRECKLDLRAGHAMVGEHAHAARQLFCTDEAPPEFGTLAAPTSAPYLAFGFPGPLSDAPTTPWRIRPSQLANAENTVAQRIEWIDLAASVPMLDDTFDDASKRGTAWHLVFRTALLRADLMTNVQRATGLDTAAVTAIEAQARALKAWLNGMGYDQLHCELPVQIEEASGAQINATIDLLAEGPEGFLIVDHKSGASMDLDAGYATYRPQLAAYAAVIERVFPEKRAAGMAINWMRQGTVVWEKL